MPRKKLPTLAVTMILKDDVAEDLRTCLKSVAPYADQIILVDTGPKRNSASVVGPEFNAEVYTFDWCQDFAKARNETLPHIKTDFFLWIDHDDVLQGGELIKPLLSSLDDDALGVLAYYDYSHDEFKNVDTTHLRERILRTDVGWHWQNRIHEVAVPHRSGSWERTEDIRWIHLKPRGNETARNLPILLDWYKDEPDNIRIWMFLGNQYNVDGQAEKAAQWYTKVWTDKRASASDRLHCMTFAAHNWRQLGNLKEAIRANMAAITEFATVAEGYLGMCENMIALKKWKEAIAFGEQVIQREPPEPFSFINPLDYTFRVWADLNVAYAAEGMLDKAIAACEMALRTRPEDKNILKNLEIYRARAQKEKALDAFVELHGNGTALTGMKYLPQALRQEKKARDVWVPALLTKAYRGTQPRIVFFCGETLEEWDATTPHTKGIGGSETAVVVVANRLAQMGWQPVVYNRTGAGEGYHEGVLYAFWERFRPRSPADVFVSWRLPTVIKERPNAPLSYLWCHDLHYRDALTPEVAAGYTKVLGVSEWHASYMKEIYPFLENVGFVPNGVDLSRFDVKAGPKHHARFVYASSPDRGLATLLRFWPHIRRVEPMAELHIYYGWETFLKQAEQGVYDLYRLHDQIMQMGQQPGVVWRGRVDQKTLAKEFLEADIWAHPTSFLETFCITAIEAMAADLLIVTSGCGNIPYIVGDVGVCIPGNAGSIAYGRRFLGLTYAMMMDGQTRHDYRGRGPKRAPLFTWEKAMEKWTALLGKKELVCA